MSFSHGDWGLPTKERTRTWTLKNFKLVFWPKFCFSPSCPGASGFLSRPTCLPPVLAGGSIINSSLQLQRNKLWPGYQWTVTAPGLAVPRLSLADLESLRAASPSDPSLPVDSTGKECLATNLSFQAPSLAEPTWASGKFKSESIMSRPVTLWGCSGIRSGRLTPDRRYLATPV